MASVPILLLKPRKLFVSRVQWSFSICEERLAVISLALYHVLFLLCYVARVCLGLESVFNHHSEQARHRYRQIICHCFESTMTVVIKID